MLDERFRRLSPDEERGQPRRQRVGDAWPEDSAWDFVALGRGHDLDFWTRFVDTLREVDADRLKQAATPVPS